MKNSRDLLVKALIKDTLKDEKVSYQQMYSNIIKKDESLRIKLFNINGDAKKIAKKLNALKIGNFEILKSPSIPGVSSVVIYVDKENIV